MSAGERAEVMEIREGSRLGTCSPGHKQDKSNQTCRMKDMGLHAGKVVEMLNNKGKGAILIRIDESRIAIGRGMAMKIMVNKTE